MCVVYDLSEPVQAIWKELFIDPVLNDQRSDRDRGTRLGYEFDTIRVAILQHGRADFGRGHEGDRGALTADDKALLYAFVNAKRHFFACRKIIDSCDGLAATLQRGRTTVIDLGCGPATAGLAVAESFPGSIFDYVGIDSAVSMLRLGDRVMRSAIGGLISADCTTAWREDWMDLNIDPARDVILILSYLCSSDSLEVRSLFDLVERTRRSRQHGSVWLLYLNSEDARAGAKYDELTTLLQIEQRPQRLVSLYSRGGGTEAEAFLGAATRWDHNDPAATWLL